MTKKILSAFICMSMLFASVAMLASAEIIVDVSDLFGNNSYDNGYDEDGNPIEGTDPDDDGSVTEPDDKTNTDDGKDEDEKTPEDDDKNETPSIPEVTIPDPSISFTNNYIDVKESDWYYPTVSFVVSNGIFSGLSDTEFGPNVELNRAMLVTILYRVAGSPAVTGECKFTDIADNAWYKNPVIWASENGIVNGLDETTFAPENSITREQIAAIIYRYASVMGYNTTFNADLSVYNDVSDVSKYAKTALEYIVATGIMKGVTETELCPKANATRAQAATIITRLISLS